MNTDKQYSYYIYVPGGNGTALVEKLGLEPEVRKIINDKIMETCGDIVEQVGFVERGGVPELKMAGGEFCGNATRSAAFYYLKGQPGDMKIKVNDDFVNAGVYENGHAWCEIPLYFGPDVVIKLDEGIHRVKMNGMQTLVLNDEAAAPYLADRDDLKAKGRELIRHYGLEDGEAAGVMFLEHDGDRLLMNPIVWVRSVDTLFYETACGSGTTATVMVEAWLRQESCEIDVWQPSGHAITAQITLEDGVITKARIAGVVECDDVERTVCV